MDLGTKNVMPQSLVRELIRIITSDAQAIRMNKSTRYAHAPEKVEAKHDNLF